MNLESRLVGARVSDVEYNQVVTIGLNNYSRHAAGDIEWLDREVAAHNDLVAALAFATRVTGTTVVPTVITQDEYTHDVVIRLGDELYLAYGMT